MRQTWLTVRVLNIDSFESFNFHLSFHYYNLSDIKKLQLSFPKHLSFEGYKDTNINLHIKYTFLGNFWFEANS